MSLKEYGEAQEYDTEKALRIAKIIGHRIGEAYGNLAALYLSQGKYRKADDYLERALTIRMGIGDRSGEAAGYLHLGVIYIRCGEYDRAEKYLMNALAIYMETGEKEGAVTTYAKLGLCFQSLSKHDMAA